MVELRIIFMKTEKVTKVINEILSNNTCEPWLINVKLNLTDSVKTVVDKMKK